MYFFKERTMDPATLALILKFGIPLAFRLLNDGKDNQEAIETAQETVEALATGDVVESLIAADEEQTEFIVNCLHGALSGVAEALGELLGNINDIGKPQQGQGTNLGNIKKLPG